MRLGALALVVVLAGCPSFGAGTAPTPTPAPDAPSASVPYPPGVGPDGVEHADELADAHADRLASTSYRLVSNRTVVDADGRLRSQIHVRLALAADRTYRVEVRTAGADGPVLLGRPPANATYWSNGSISARALRRGIDTTYTRFDSPDGFTGTWRYWRSTAAFGGAGGYAYGSLRSIFSDVRTRLAGSSEANGTVRFHLVGEDARAGDFAMEGDGPVRNVTLAATVTVDGLVRQFDLQYDRLVGGQPVTVRWRLVYEDVGSTTVERPPWLDRALASQDPSP